MPRLLLLIVAPLLFDAVVARALAETQADGVVETRMVFFDWDQAGLSDHARTTLAQAGQSVFEGRATEILLEAADGMGLATAYGASLSRERWSNLTAELYKNGVSPEQVVRSGRSMVTLWPRRPIMAQSASSRHALDH